jgi:ABC-type polysaccharide/polyol phosphate transport system ATPase subunit
MCSSACAAIWQALSEAGSVKDIAIRVQNVTKDFHVYEKPLDLALEILTRKKRHRAFRALDDVSFAVERGQVLGIIGANGAGKSTLLKIITGVLDASGGTVDVRGRVTAILELGLGFNPEHSGRDNIYLSGMLYGMSRAEIDQKLESIIHFSGLRTFMEQPVKTYSSGMYARLAFSIATAVDPDILIIDEALAAGDAMFVQKSMRRIRQLCAGGRTVLLVSHGTGILAQLCREVVWLEAGCVRMIGPALRVVQAYDLEAHQGADEESWIEPAEHAALSSIVEALKGDAPSMPSGAAAAHVAAANGAQAGQYDNSSTISRQSATAFTVSSHAEAEQEQQIETGKYVFRRGPVFIDFVTMLDHNGLPSTHLTTVRPFTLKIAYYCKDAVPKETLGIALAVNRLADLEPVFQWYSQFIRPDESPELYTRAPFRVRPCRRGTIELSFPYAPFRQGDYILSVGLLPNVPGTWEFYEYRHLFYPFHVVDASLGVGAPIFFEPSAVKFVDFESTAESIEAARA